MGLTIIKINLFTGHGPIEVAVANDRSDELAKFAREYESMIDELDSLRDKVELLESGFSDELSARDY